MMMSRGETGTVHLKLHRFRPDGTIDSVQVKYDRKSQKYLSRTPILVNLATMRTQIVPKEEEGFRFNCNLNFNDSSLRVVKLGGVEDLNPMNYAAEISSVLGDHQPQLLNHAEESNGRSSGVASLMPVAVKRESKVPNIPSMIRCQNCDTHFPTKYQFQRHQCEFNAEKVVLKPNVDVKDVQKGVRMKFDCPTCGKQFVSKNNLERHLTSHDEDNVNICEYCNKHFVSENRLRIHKENHCKKAGDISKFYRSDVTVWKCIKCYQVFSSDAYANSHADSCNDILDPEDYRIRGLDDDSEAVTLKEEIKSLLNDAPELVEGDPSNLHLITSKYVEKVITELLLQCEYCNKTYSDKKSLLMHQKTHTTETNYNCVVCSEVFDAYTQAGKHWLTKCSNEANLFYLPKLTYCHYCDRTFKSHEVLYSHKIKKKHYTPKRYMIESSPQPPPPDKEENKETIIKLIEDVLCSIKLNAHDHSQDTKYHTEVNGHEVTVKTEAVSETSSLIISEDAPETEALTINGKKKRGRKRKHNSQTSKGKRLAANVEPGYKYQCERCIQVFDSVLDLETHRDKEHPANYKCEECDQVVHSSKALLIHSRAHQSLKPYVCEICKRCYSQTSHLWQHMRFHQGIKPFACPHEGCEARYTIRPDLKDHIRKVHTRERPFKCSVCDKCFLTGSVYYQHRLIHTNDRRYACDICNKRFFRADALNNHRRIHTDERPYPCDVCGRHFRQKGDRNKHVRTQHPEYHV